MTLVGCDYRFKGTSIKMHEIEIDPPHVKERLVLLECLKDHAFDSTDCLRSFIIIPLARSVVEC